MPIPNAITIDPITGLPVDEDAIRIDPRTGLPYPVGSEVPPLPQQASGAIRPTAPTGAATPPPPVAVPRQVPIEMLEPVADLPAPADAGVRQPVRGTVGSGASFQLGGGRYDPYEGRFVPDDPGAESNYAVSLERLRQKHRDEGRPAWLDDRDSPRFIRYQRAARTSTGQKRISDLEAKRDAGDLSADEARELSMLSEAAADFKPADASDDVSADYLGLKRLELTGTPGATPTLSELPDGVQDPTLADRTRLADQETIASERYPALFEQSRQPTAPPPPVPDPRGLLPGTRDVQPDESPELAMIRRGIAQERDAVALGQLSAIAANAASSEKARLDAKRIEEDQARLETERRIRDTRMAEVQKEYDDWLTDFRNSKVNANEWWESRSDAQRFAAGFSIFMSGIASGLLGRSGNTAMSIINGAIERNIAAQRINLEAKAQVGGALRSKMGMIRQNFSDQVAADSAIRALYLQRTSAELEARLHESGSKDADVLARFTQAQGQLEQRAAEELLKAKELEAATRLKQARLGINPSQQGLTGIPGLDLYVSQLSPAVREKLLPKVVEEAGNLNEYRQGVQAIGRIYDETKELGVTVPWTSGVPGTESRGKQIANESEVLAVVQGLWKGNPSDKDLAVIRGFLPYRNDTDAQIDAKRRGLLEFIRTNRKPTPIIDSATEKLRLQGGALTPRAVPTPRSERRELPSVTNEAGDDSTGFSRKTLGRLGLAPGARVSQIDPSADTAGKSLLAKRVADETQRRRIERAIDTAADRHDVPRDLLYSLAETESKFDPDAVGRSKAGIGGVGLFQVIEKTGRRFGAVGEGYDRRRDVNVSADVGARYLRFLLDRYDGDVALALMAYNAGEGAIDRAIAGGRQ